jgi:hypothetical protein
MRKLALLLCLSISGVATPVFGQEASAEARFSMRSFNLSMSERMLTSRLAKPDEAALAMAAIELREFEKGIQAFQEQGRDLSTFLFLKEWDDSNRRAIAGGAEKLEDVADDLIAYLGEPVDDVDAAQESAVSRAALLGQLSRVVVRILPRLERVVLTSKQNLMDVRMQGEILEQFATVKRLCGLLRE